MNDVTWDPLRKKEVALTPEEQVRQWFIRFLADTAGVPIHMMMSEASLMLGKKSFRADILISDRKARPIAVVECKRPEVKLDSQVLAQAVRYNMVLNVDYIIITNGTKTHICSRRGPGEDYKFIDHMPDYEEMTGENRNNGSDTKSE